MKRHLQTLAAALLLGAFALAQDPARGRFGPPGFSVADAQSATGWTYNTVTGITSTGGLRIDLATANILRTAGVVYLDLNNASGVNLGLNASTDRLRVVTGGLIVDSAQTKGTITLSGGTGTATVFAGAVCVCGTQTANAVRCSVVTTTLTCTGTGTDACNYLCL